MGRSLPRVDFGALCSIFFGGFAHHFDPAQSLQRHLAHADRVHILFSLFSVYPRHAFVAFLAPLRRHLHGSTATRSRNSRPSIASPAVANLFEGTDGRGSRSSPWIRPACGRPPSSFSFAFSETFLAIYCNPARAGPSTACAFAVIFCHFLYFLLFIGLLGFGIGNGAGRGNWATEQGSHHTRGSYRILEPKAKIIRTARSTQRVFCLFLDFILLFSVLFCFVLFYFDSFFFICYTSCRWPRGRDIGATRPQPLPNLVLFFLEKNHILSLSISFSTWKTSSPIMRPAGMEKGEGGVGQVSKTLTKRET